MFGTRRTRERMQSTWTVSPGCLNSPPCRSTATAPSATAAAVCAASTSVCASDPVRGSASGPSSGSPTATREAHSAPALQKPLHLHILQLPAAILLTPHHLKDSPASSTLMLCDISYVSNN